MKRIPLFCLILFLLFFLLCFPQESLQASRQGLGLWLNTLLPTLLPFMILSNLLIFSGSLDKLISLLPGLQRASRLSPYGIYAILLGFLCGYPMGAKLTADLYGKQKISKKEAEYLLTFVNNPSPAFLSSYVLLQCLEMKGLILPSFLILYSADFVCAAIFYHRLPVPEAKPSFENKKQQTAAFFPKNKTSRSHSENEKKETSASHPQGAYIDLSIMNGFETITRLGGYILLFSLLAAALRHFWPAKLPGCLFVLSITEISTGLAALSASGLPFPLLYAWAMGCTSFGGLCILAQTKGVINESGLSVRLHVLSKCLCAGLTFVFALLLSLS